MQLQPTTQNITTSGTIAPGMRHIEFILSSDFSGAINGASLDGSSIGVYSIDAPAGDVLSGMNYVISAGSAILTVY